MKKTFFDKTIIGLVLAVFASVALAAGAVVADDLPTASPSAGSYVSPTFGGVTVVPNGEIKTTKLRSGANMFFEVPTASTPIAGFRFERGDDMLFDIGLSPASNAITAYKPFIVKEGISNTGNDNPVIIDDQLNVKQLLTALLGVNVTGDLNVSGVIKNNSVTDLGCGDSDGSCGEGGETEMPVTIGDGLVVLGNLSATSLTVSGPLETSGVLKVYNSLNLENASSVIKNVKDGEPVTIDDQLKVNELLTALLGVNVTGDLTVATGKTTTKSLDVTEDLTVETGKTTTKFLDVTETLRTDNIEPIDTVNGLQILGGSGSHFSSYNSTVSGLLSARDITARDITATGKSTINLDKGAMFIQKAGNIVPIDANTSNLTPKAECPTGYFPIGCGFDSSAFVNVGSMYINSTGKCSFSVRNNHTSSSLNFTPYANCLKGN